MTTNTTTLPTITSPHEALRLILDGQSFASIKDRIEVGEVYDREHWRTFFFGSNAATLYQDVEIKRAFEFFLQR